MENFSRTPQKEPRADLLSPISTFDFEATPMSLPFSLDSNLLQSNQSIIDLTGSDEPPVKRIRRQCSVIDLTGIMEEEEEEDDDNTTIPLSMDDDATIAETVVDEDARPPVWDIVGKERCYV